MNHGLLENIGVGLLVNALLTGDYGAVTAGVQCLPAEGSVVFCAYLTPEGYVCYMEALAAVWQFGLPFDGGTKVVQ